MKTLTNIIMISVLFFMVSCKDQSQDQTDLEATNEPITERSDINKVEPPYWWTGFNNTKLQLLVKHPNIKAAEPSITHSGVSIEKVHTADSPNYLFIDLNISDRAKAGKFNITFKLNDEELVQTYELKTREKAAEDFIGFDSSDAIYLITPDRYANADPNNDSVEGLLEQGTDRTHGYKRHGGDIQGITNHLDYIDDMGYTAIWSSPLLINDMKEGSYHGYAMTDYYRVDPRFGSFEDYRELADKARERGIKIIMDQVANHCGLEHWWMKDLPFKDWVNFQENYEANIDNWNWETTKFSNHRRTTNQDIYASDTDKQGMTDGWFVDAMPDLNQRNPFMATYIIQNSIWWIEALGLGGIRQDTYPYPDKDFMSDWAGAIMTEYPNFNIVGEEWSYNPLLIAYWQEGNQNSDGYDSNLKSSMDFAMQQNITDGLKEEEAWNTGLVKLYEGLANDFVYPSPKDIMVFNDNHDMSRIFTQLNGDVTMAKTAVAHVLMLPRTPQLYYGTEILMQDFANPGDHGLIRTDFAGGWAGDAVNAFTGEGLTEDQKGMQDFVKRVLNFRKNNKAIHEGETKHFAPLDGTYILFRYNDDETVVHIINKNDNPYTLDLKRYDEMGLNGKTLKNIITGEDVVWGDEMTLTEKGSYILTTKLN